MFRHFLHTSAWLHSRDVNALRTPDIEAWINEPHRKVNGGLKEAYEIALEPRDWIKYWEEGQAKIQKELEKQAAEAEDVDELEDDDAPSGGKRKRNARDKKEKRKKAKSAKKVSPGIQILHRGGYLLIDFAHL